MIEFLIDQIVMVSVFILFAILAQGVNMLVGAWINRSRFDWSKFLSGLHDPVWIYALVILIVTMVSVVPFLLEYYGILTVDLAGLEEFTGRSVAILAFVYGVNRIKDAGKKMMEQIGLKQEIEVPEIEETEGVG